MTTIVLNTQTGAVSEYDWALQSTAAGRGAGAAGLFSLAGSTDDSVPITGEIRSGRPEEQTAIGVGQVFFTLQGQGGTLIVEGRTSEWSYPVAARAGGLARATPGAGIRETAIGLGYRNTADFRLDRIDAELFASKQRRI